MPRNGSYAGSGQQPHFFSQVPIIEFLNNEEGLSEPFKATELIDAYDEILSDGVSEVEQLRMAYMWARGAGMSLDADFEKQLQQTGIWPLPQDGEIGFAGKDLGGASGFVVEVINELRRNIYSFSKSMDLSEDRGGDMRVIGWQIAMLRMEMSAQVTERKFRKSYNRQYQMLTDFWRANEPIDIDPLSLRYTFTRKFPKDVDMEIETLVKGIEVLPLEKIYSLMSFIENPAELAEQFKEERPEMNDILSNLENAESQLE
jgi:SPP1 family phage portal protein